MTDLSPPIAFEDVLLEGTRQMSRGARMNPELYHALKGEIQSLDNTAACMTLPEGTSPTTVRNWILHVAAVLGIPATVGKTPAGLLFWRSSEEDQQKAQEAAGRLQRSQHKGKAAPQRPARFTATSAGRSLRDGANHTFDEPIHA